MSELEHYFAYGSNLSPSRLQARVPQARVVGCARLLDWRLVFDKHGRDGTAKANIRRCPGDEVWGAVYRVAPCYREPLDLAEGLGTEYELRELKVALAGEQTSVYTYVALRLRAGLPLENWYLRHILEGVSHHALPTTWHARVHSLTKQCAPPAARGADGSGRGAGAASHGVGTVGTGPR